MGYLRSSHQSHLPKYMKKNKQDGEFNHCQVERDKLNQIFYNIKYPQKNAEVSREEVLWMKLKHINQQINKNRVSPFEMNKGFVQSLFNVYQEKRVMNYDRYADNQCPKGLGNRQKMAGLHEVIPSGSQFIFRSPEKGETKNLSIFSNLHI
eukprot:403342131